MRKSPGKCAPSSTSSSTERIIKMVAHHMSLWTPKSVGENMAKIKPFKTDLKSTVPLQRRTTPVSYTADQSLFIQKVIGDLSQAGFIFKNNGCPSARLFPSPSAASADRRCFNLDYTDVEKSN